MKSFKIIFLSALFAFFFSVNTDACPIPGAGNQNNTPAQNQNGNQNGKVNHGRHAVGVPIDGGLLTILGAAGAAYFVSRRKKKNQE